MQRNRIATYLMKLAEDLALQRVVAKPLDVFKQRLYHLYHNHCPYLRFTRDRCAHAGHELEEVTISPERQCKLKENIPCTQGLSVLASRGAGVQRPRLPRCRRKYGEALHIAVRASLTILPADMVHASNLRKTYGRTVAVDGVSFGIPAGETFGLLGPNGAGKTTTIHLLVGVLKPDGGEIRIDGATDPTRPEVRRRIGIAPQSLALYDELTGEENLKFFGRLYGVNGTELRERVRWALEFVQLTDRARKRVKTYSGGMQRRLNMACALLHDPAVILFDEPTVGVDPQSRNHIFDNIETLKATGRTILYTTHYMEEAQRLCDRVAIMDQGKILAMDTVGALIANHGGRSVITAELERPPENPDDLPGIFDGTSLRLDTDRPLEDVARLAGRNITFRTLRLDRPDLETVFLALTGRSLRD